MNIRSTANKTDLADLLALQIRALRLPEPVREHRGVEGRLFRSDLAWPALKVCCEVDGGEMLQGRHNRAGGMASDCEKANLLNAAGWFVFRFTGTMVRNGAAIAFLEQFFATTASGLV